MRIRILSAALAAVVCLSLATAGLGHPNSRGFHGDKVLSVHVPSEIAMERLLTALGASDSVSVWKADPVPGIWDLHVQAAGVNSFTTALTSSRLVFHELHDDLGAAIDAHMDLNERAQAPESAGFFDAYASELQLNAFLASLTAQFPDLVTMENIGTTVEGRNITAMRICSSDDCSALPAIVFNGCQHAREWLSPMTVTYVLNGLLSNYTFSDDVREVVDGFEWWFVPVVNVDGYVYSWEENRLWRKNRRVNPDSPCVGVDLNRNWGYAWGIADSHTSDISCAETYFGAEPFSEPEETAVANLIAGLGRVEWYIDYHMYGGLFMFPWSYTCDSYTEDVSIEQSMADAYTSAVKSVHGTSFVVDSSCKAMYQASGFSIDWTYAEIGSVYSYCCELSGTTFLEPPTVILPTGQEHFQGVVAGAGFILQNPRHPHS